MHNGMARERLAGPAAEKAAEWTHDDLMGSALNMGDAAAAPQADRQPWGLRCRLSISDEFSIAAETACAYSPRLKPSKLTPAIDDHQQLVSSRVLCVYLKDSSALHAHRATRVMRCTHDGSGYHLRLFRRQ